MQVANDSLVEKPKRVRAEIAGKTKEKTKNNPEIQGVVKSFLDLLAREQIAPRSRIRPVCKALLTVGKQWGQAEYVQLLRYLEGESEALP